MTCEVEAMEGFSVPRADGSPGASMEPPRALALSYSVGDFTWVWQFGLYPLDKHRTRLVTRGTEAVPHTLLWWLGMRVMEPMSFIMTRRFLLGVKQRAETRTASKPPTTTPTPSARPEVGAAAS
jgi:hypothetical protein